MATLIIDPSLEEQLLAERQAFGGDRYDEVWEGTYVMVPLAGEEHQDLATTMAAVVKTALGWKRSVKVYAGINVSDRRKGWEKNYRIPDLAVVLERSKAVTCRTHLFGGPDFAAEITSPGDRSREKLEFYAAIGVRELMIVDREPWSLELYRLSRRKLLIVGQSTLKQPVVLESSVLGLRFRLIRGKPRPRIEVTVVDGTESWLV